MPTYRNISKATYCNTKYNIFNIDPGETFEIDKYIDSPSLEIIDDNPPAKYEGSVEYVLNAGQVIDIDSSEWIEVAIIPDANNNDSDYVYISVNTPIDISTDKLKLTVQDYYYEKYLQLKNYNKIYIQASDSNSNPFKIKIIYKYK